MSQPVNKPERKSKMFWVAEDTRVRHLLCYECPPNDDVWWCPEAGFSGNVKFHFFEDKASATARVRYELSKDVAEMQKALAEL